MKRLFAAAIAVALLVVGVMDADALRLRKRASWQSEFGGYVITDTVFWNTTDSLHADITNAGVDTSEAIPISGVDALSVHTVVDSTSGTPDINVNFDVSLDGTTWFTLTENEDAVSSGTDNRHTVLMTTVVPDSAAAVAGDVVVRDLPITQTSRFLRLRLTGTGTQVVSVYCVVYRRWPGVNRY